MIIIYNPLMFNQSKIQQKFVMVELFNTFYNDYIEYNHYINDILEKLEVNGNIFSQFTETNDLEKSC